MNRERPVASGFGLSDGIISFIRKSLVVSVASFKRTRNALSLMLFFSFQLPITLAMIIVGYSATYQIESAKSELLETILLAGKSNMLSGYYGRLSATQTVYINIFPFGEQEFTVQDVFTVIVIDDLKAPTVTIYSGVDSMLSDEYCNAVYNQALLSGSMLSRDDTGEVINMVAQFSESSSRNWVFGITGFFQFLYESVEDDPSVVGRRSNETFITGYFFVDFTCLKTYKESILIKLFSITVLLTPVHFFISLIVANHLISPAIEAWNKQRRFIADAAHELKTPLTMISSGVSSLNANREMSVASQDKWLEGITTGISRFMEMSNDLLDSAKLETDSHAYVIEPTNISELIQTLVDKYANTIQAKGLSLISDIELGVFRSSNYDLLERAAAALLDNAIKYTEPNGLISVKVSGSSGTVSIIIENTGPGIDGDDLAHIFEPFFRSSKLYNNSETGHGLGLSIAKQAVELVHGKIEASSIPGQTTVFSILL